jgi:hypothetical protein
MKTKQLFLNALYVFNNLPMQHYFRYDISEPAATLIEQPLLSP